MRFVTECHAQLEHVSPGFAERLVHGSKPHA